MKGNSPIHSFYLQGNIFTYGRRILMRCGTKRFIAEIEIDGKKQTKPIIARTPAEARKNIRKTYGKNTTIYSVIEEKQ